jgi:hypothetical protein
MLTVSVPTLAEVLAEVNEASEDASLRDLDALVGRNVVGAVLVHCVYSCTAVADDHPVMHVAGNPVPDSRITTASPSAPSARDVQWLEPRRRSK